MAEHQRHHFVPGFYLAGFTPSGTKDDFLNVLDQTSRKRWRARPDELAHQRNLYRVEVPEIDPNVFEKAFGDLEGQVATSLRQLFDSGVPPESKACSDLMFFVALLAVRIPHHRAQTSEGIDRLSKRLMRMGVANPDRWQKIVEQIRADGLHDLADTRYEEMKAMVESDDFTVDFPQTWHVSMLYDEAKTIFPFLARRQWRFFCAEDDAGDFICSDHPVALVWTTETTGFYPPGFGVGDTEVSVPLSRRWAMLGRFEEGGGTYQATPRTVAAINSRTAMCADQLYFGAEDFVLSKRDGTIGRTADLSDWINQREAAKGSEPKEG